MSSCLSLRSFGKLEDLLLSLRYLGLPVLQLDSEPKVRGSLSDILPQSLRRLCLVDAIEHLFSYLWDLDRAVDAGCFPNLEVARVTVPSSSRPYADHISPEKRAVVMECESLIAKWAERGRPRLIRVLSSAYPIEYWF